MPRPILIDTDTASDDAVALIMALRSPAVDVRAITTVAGNCSVQQATSNALYTAELCGSQVPIYPGAARPLQRDLVTADWFHGADGLGDHGYAPASRTAAPTHAVDAILETVRTHPGIEIITLGPLTNLALALDRDPTIARSISRLVIMGGAPCCEGNVTPAAEFNIWVDPEAARTVFSSSAPIELIGWHLCRHAAALSQQDVARILALHTPLADFAIRCNSTAAAAYHTQTGEHGISLPDPVAMSILLDPALKLHTSRHFVAIECASDLTRGMTVVDRLNRATDPRNAPTWHPITHTNHRVEVTWTLNIPGWKSALVAALSTSESA